MIKIIEDASTTTKETEFVSLQQKANRFVKILLWATILGWIFVVLGCVTFFLDCIIIFLVVLTGISSYEASVYESSVFGIIHVAFFLGSILSWLTSISIGIFFMRRIKLKVLTSANIKLTKIGTSISIIPFVFLLLFGFLTAPGKTILTTSKYSKIRNIIYPAVSYCGHFPRTSFNNSKNGRFLFNGPDFQVIYNLPHQQIENLFKEYTIKRRTKTDLPEGCDFDFPGGYYYKRLKSSNFTIFILDARPYYIGKTGPNWNHGDRYGVAIDDVENQIVYWAETW